MGQHNLNFTSPYVDAQCQHHQRVLEKSWILGENAINGLCNQILGIFSYVPVALLWDVDLVVGEMFSRPSFQVAPSNHEGWKRVPFSTFFDWMHFSTFWLQHGLRTVEYHEYLQDRYNTQSTMLTIVKDPSFWPVKNSILMEMLSKSSIPCPIPPDKVLKFDNEHSKFTALFNYWKGGLKHKLLLLKVHNSLKPSPAISRVLQALVDELPIGRDFMSVHVRLETDYLLFKKLSFDKELPVALAHIRGHKCFRFDRSCFSNSSASTCSLPIFVASGLFSGISKGNYASTVRAQSLLSGLKELGFTEVYTRQSLIDRVMRNGTKLSMLGGVDAFNLLPEVGAMVDLLISRHDRCRCFVDSHKSSSFSYMAQRLRQMDGGQVIKYTEITPELFGVSEEFKQWGV